MNLQVEERVSRPAVSTTHRIPTTDIVLEPVQAKRWLEYLEGLSLGGDAAEALSEFREQLDDAIWLARWKREYVVIELELARVPSLIGALSSLEPDLSADRSLDAQHDLLLCLSKMPRWT